MIYFFWVFFMATSFAKAPSDYAVVQQQAKKLGLINVAPHHKGEKIDDLTYVGSVSHGEFHSSITLIAMHKQDKEWQKKWSYSFPHPKDNHGPEGGDLFPCNVMSGEEEYVRPKIYLKVDDFDKDGQPELLVRTINCHIT